jgi:DNA ligase-associated metallophosphoesterase
VLLPERAVWLPEFSTLLVADVHIGKAASFRRLGTPVPEATTAATLARLSQVLQRTRARRLLVLGDLSHSAAAHQARSTDAAFGDWRAAHAEIELTLVAGNHDQHAGAPPPAWGVQIVAEPYELAGLALVHHPQAVPGRYALAGHVHPAIVIGGRGPGSMRLPCFHLGADCGVLPAFGDFTGSHVVHPVPGDRIVVIAEGELREWPVPPERRAGMR